MKVTRLCLKHIRCFEELTLDLKGESALLVGDNGDGKSTVLRSLAMGLCDESSASALFRDLYGESVRRGSEQGTIEVDLEDRTGCFQTETTIRSLDRFESVDQELNQLQENGQRLPLKPDKFPWDRIFTTGYGPGIRVHGTEDYDYYLAVDALHPLFVNDRPLQNPELVMRRLVASRGKEPASANILGTLTDLLRRILQLESDDSVQLADNAIEIKNKQDHYPLSSVGDGYHSTVTWVLDLLSWWYLSGPSDLTDIDGIVLIDEIEQHLHPRWQRNIMQLLTESFPGVQFIATTHSPLVASGCKNIKVYKLNDGDYEEVFPFGWRAEEVYIRMGLPTSRAEAFAKRLLEFQQLDNKRLHGRKFSDEEEEDFKRLREQMGNMPDTDPVQLATELENLVQFARKSSQNNS